MDTPSRIAAGRIARLVGWKYSGNITEAAKAIGCGYWPLYRLIKQARVPSADILKQCADHFDIPLNDLMAPEEEPPQRRRRVRP